VRKLQKLTHDLNIENFVEFRARMPKSQLLGLLENATILLLINSCGSRHNVFIPAKFFDYLEIQKPILCLTEDGALSRAIERTKAGVMADPQDPNDVCRTLLEMFEQFYIKKEPFVTDENKIGEYEAHNTTKKLALLCDNLLES
jgi:hypothetical protein